MNRPTPSFVRLAAAASAAGLLLTGCQPPPPATGIQAGTNLPAPEAKAEWSTGTEPDAAPMPDVTFRTGDLGGKTLLMHYMPWYEAPPVRPAWGTHWTGHRREHNPEQLKENGLPDIWSHYHPLIGLYDSTDPAVLECHLLEMKLAGVNGVIVDWYGTAPHGDFPPIHEATEALFEACGRYGMTFSVCYEDRTVDLLVNHFKVLTTNEVQHHLNGIFAWMQDHWFTAPQYQLHQERPLVLNFGPMYEPFRQPEPWAEAMASLPVKPIFFGLHHLWRKAGGDGGLTWVSFDALAEGQTRDVNLRRINESFTWFTGNPAEAIVSAFPGFKDVYGEGGKPNQLLDHRGGDVLRETLEVGLGGPWDIIQLVTWNDYGEGTMFEPTHEFGYLFLEILQEARRAEIGDAFTFTPDDLRLPARLLALRRTGRADAAELNEIAALLANGSPAEAGERIAALEAE